MLMKTLIPNPPDNYKWYNLESDTPGKAILQIETGIIYGGVTMREDDPHTYEECDDPNYINEENINEITNSNSTI